MDIGQRRTTVRSWFAFFAVLMAVVGAADAAPLDPEVYRIAFEKAKNDAEVVAEVRVLTVLCKEVTKEDDKVRAVTLQVALQVLAVEKGALEKNALVVVAHAVTLPSGGGPGAYAYTAAVRQFPFTPGVKGRVALRWDKHSRAYVSVSGWVAEPNRAAIPKEVGKALSAKD